MSGMALRLAALLRSALGNDERRALARVATAGAEDAARRRALDDAAAYEMESIARSGQPSICLGTSVDRAGRTFAVRLRERELRGGGHFLITGATGSGKSYFVLALIQQMLASRPGGCVLIDMKGELATLVRERALPALFASLPDEAAERLATRVAVIAPFAADATTPFQVLARDPELTLELQAHEVAASFGHTVGRDLGILQQTILKYALLLAADVGLTFPDLPALLQNPALLRGALARTRLVDVKTYFARRFPKERQGSLAALLSRLEMLIMHEPLRRMMLARGMVRFDRLIENGIVIVDLGGAPAGMGSLATFFGQILFQKIMRSVFRRRVGERTTPVALIADEFQELVSSEVAHDFERFLTLSRSQRVFLWAMFQQAAQVEAVSPTLLRILRANTNYQLLFRSNLEDARQLAYILPTTGTVPRGPRTFPDPRTAPAVLTEEEERRTLLECVPQMPDRLFWFSNRRRPYPAILTKSPTVVLNDLDARAAEVPAEVRALLRRGILAVGRDELEETLAERARFRAALSGTDAARSAPSPTAVDPPTDPGPSEENAAPTPAPEQPHEPRRRRSPALG